jgi:hypothetical protein
LPDPSDSAIRKLAHEILARREFGLMDESQPQWVHWLRRFVAWIGHLRVQSPVLYWMFIGAVAAVCAAAIVQLVWVLRAALRAREPALAPKLAAARPDLAAEASRLADSGRFLEAGHRLMIASFGLLAERSVIELRPDRSNRWIRAALRGSALAGTFGAEIATLVERTERRWFGDRRNEAEIYFDWRSVYQRLLSSGN